ncbi:hypothetical protein BGZ60DRAFT_518731 [Tricladium varicosporioides]|nr:hypothetical protein BGZ60DRAFT_518731 [Hymenoscyphus varicosporioides]
MSSALKMIYPKNIVVFTLVFQLLQSVLASKPKPSFCKAFPGSQDWPSLSQWASLNASVSGRLLKSSSPGAVCHQGQLAYNATECSKVLNGWYTVLLHTEDPVSSAWNNWNNDSCLPTLPSPCSGEGYPVYVINATSKEDVKVGVDFAREHNIRLNVKSTGHDYLGRSTSPNSLSIWTHHLKGISIAKSFRPEGCNFSINVPAITAGGGNQMGEVNLAANREGLYILSGGSKTVSYGGYLTGGGHSALSATYGMAADSVLELEIVSPSGEFMILNECQNQDLFWATRGETALSTASTILASVVLSCYPSSPPKTPLPPSPQPYCLFSRTSQPHTLSNFLSLSTFYDWWLTRNSSDYAGIELVVGSRLVGTDALQNIDALETALKGVAPSNTAGKGLNFYLLGGEGVRNAVPRGGMNAINPAWRRSLVHADLANKKKLVTGATWTPLDNAAKIKETSYLTNTTMQYLRDLDPDSGAYVNEADPNEPNWQQAFWGSNYDKLLEIKRKVDPGDVFWCQPCVGSERWKTVEDKLCKV